MKTRIFLTLLGLGATMLLLPGCYIYSYYPETDTYVTTVETKKFVNRNYSRERLMEANNSDCYACHNSKRVMVPQHQGSPAGMQPQPIQQGHGLPAGHPPLGQAPMPPQQQWSAASPQAIPGMPGIYSGGSIPPHMVPMTHMGPAYGAVPPMVGTQGQPPLPQAPQTFHSIPQQPQPPQMNGAPPVSVAPAENGTSTQAPNGAGNGNPESVMQANGAQEPALGPYR